MSMMRFFFSGEDTVNAGMPLPLPGEMLLPGAGYANLIGISSLPSSGTSLDRMSIIALPGLE